ncbi:unnamed protein product [Amoebophrya sp. A120]|nr:unnamed protein product [Amoebophrya sp. A120]|eukprot:GSA120T00019741001.1
MERPEVSIRKTVFELFSNTPVPMFGPESDYWQTNVVHATISWEAFYQEQYLRKVTAATRGDSSGTSNFQSDIDFLHTVAKFTEAAVVAANALGDEFVYNKKLHQANTSYAQGASQTRSLMQNYKSEWNRMSNKATGLAMFEDDITFTGRGLVLIVVKGSKQQGITEQEARRRYGHEVKTHQFLNELIAKCECETLVPTLCCNVYTSGQVLVHVRPKPELPQVLLVPFPIPRNAGSSAQLVMQEVKRIEDKIFAETTDADDEQGFRLLADLTGKNTAANKTGEKIRQPCLVRTRNTSSPGAEAQGPGGAFSALQFHTVGMLFPRDASSASLWDRLRPELFLSGGNLASTAGGGTSLASGGEDATAQQKFLQNPYEVRVNEEARRLSGIVRTRLLAEAAEYLDRMCGGEFAVQEDGSAGAGKIPLQITCSATLTRFLHARGVNCRYIGQLCGVCKEQHSRTLLTVEAVARTCKKILRDRIKLAPVQINGTNLRDDNFVAPYYDVILQLFQDTIGESQRTQRFWVEMLVREVLEKFPGIPKQLLKPDGLPQDLLLHALQYHFGVGAILRIVPERKHYQDDFISPEDLDIVEDVVPFEAITAASSSLRYRRVATAGSVTANLAATEVLKNYRNLLAEQIKEAAASLGGGSGTAEQPPESSTAKSAAALFSALLDVRRLDFLPAVEEIDLDTTTASTSSAFSALHAATSTSIFERSFFVLNLELSLAEAKRDVVAARIWRLKLGQLAFLAQNYEFGYQIAVKGLLAKMRERHEEQVAGRVLAIACAVGLQRVQTAREHYEQGKIAAAAARAGIAAGQAKRMTSIRKSRTTPVPDLITNACFEIQASRAFLLVFSQTSGGGTEDPPAGDGSSSLQSGSTIMSTGSLAAQAHVDFLTDKVLSTAPAFFSPKARRPLSPKMISGSSTSRSTSAASSSRRENSNALPVAVVRARIAFGWLLRKLVTSSSPSAADTEKNESYQRQPLRMVVPEKEWFKVKNFLQEALDLCGPSAFSATFTSSHTAVSQNQQGGAASSAGSFGRSGDDLIRARLLFQLATLALLQCERAKLELPNTAIPLAETCLATRVAKSSSHAATARSDPVVVQASLLLAFAFEYDKQWKQAVQMYDEILLAASTARKDAISTDETVESSRRTSSRTARQILAATNSQQGQYSTLSPDFPVSTTDSAALLALVGCYDSGDSLNALQKIPETELFSFSPTVTSWQERRRNSSRRPALGLRLAGVRRRALFLYLRFLFSDTEKKQLMKTVAKLYRRYKMKNLAKTIGLSHTATSHFDVTVPTLVHFLESFPKIPDLTTTVAGSSRDQDGDPADADDVLPADHASSTLEIGILRHPVFETAFTAGHGTRFLMQEVLRWHENQFGEERLRRVEADDDFLLIHVLQWTCRKASGLVPESVVEIQ